MITVIVKKLNTMMAIIAIMYHNNKLMPMRVRKQIIMSFII